MYFKTFESKSCSLLRCAIWASSFRRVYISKVVSQRFYHDPPRSVPETSKSGGEWPIVFCHQSSDYHYHRPWWQLSSIPYSSFGRALVGYSSAGRQDPVHMAKWHAELVDWVQRLENKASHLAITHGNFTWTWGTSTERPFLGTTASSHRYLQPSYPS
jgi:hypothetical protein